MRFTPRTAVLAAATSVVLIGASISGVVAASASPAHATVSTTLAAKTVRTAATPQAKIVYVTGHSCALPCTVLPAGAKVPPLPTATVTVPGPTVTVSASATAPAPSTSTSVSTAPPATLVGLSAVADFYRGLDGQSVFTQTDAGDITITGTYSHLIPGNSYYTVIYGNGTCDPAQAFPVGPFTADANGNATLNVTKATTVPVSGTMSMSVRRAATVYDVKANGVPYTLPAVVAIAGTPSIGLIECDASPTLIQ